MAAGAEEIAQRAVNQLAVGRQFGGAEISGPEEAVNGGRRAQYLKLSGWIDPRVVPPVGEQDRSRRAQRHQAMLIKRQPLGLVIDLFESRVEPMRELVVDLFDGFRRFASLVGSTRYVSPKGSDFFGRR